jgi:hypothetical protein
MAEPPTEQDGDPGTDVPPAAGSVPLGVATIPSQEKSERDTVTLTLPRPAGAPTELRVHGVSGTPAEDMLDRPRIVQVAGDGEAGFFRPRPEYGATTGPGGARLEAYRWGNLTAGAAACVLAAPTAVHVGQRGDVASAGGRDGPADRAWLVSALRGEHVGQSGAGPVGVVVDLIGWQCPRRPVRAAAAVAGLLLHRLLRAARLVAVAAVVPILVICGLWWLAVRSWAKYESYKLPQRNADGDGLATPTFWDGRDQVGRLRSIHIAAMFAVLDGVLLYVLLSHDLRTDAYAGVDLGRVAPDNILLAGKILGGVVGGILVLSVLLLLVPPMVERVSKSRAASIFAVTVAVGGAGHRGAPGYALLPRADWSTGTAAGLRRYGDKLFAAQTAMLVLLALVVLFQRHRARALLAASVPRSWRRSRWGSGLPCRPASPTGWPSLAATLSDATDITPLDEGSSRRCNTSGRVGFVLLVAVVIWRW